MAACILAAFAYIDQLIMPEYADVLFRHRLASFSVFLMIILVSYHPLLKRHIQKVARYEIIKLFNGEHADDYLVKLAKLELKLEKGLSRSSISRQKSADSNLPLRERYHRQANALMVILQDKKASKVLRYAAVKALGNCGDQRAIPILEKIRKSAPRNSMLKKAAQASMESIQKTQKQTVVFASMEVQPFANAGGLSNVMRELHPEQVSGWLEKRSGIRLRPF